MTRCDGALAGFLPMARGAPELPGLFAQFKRHKQDSLRCGILGVVGRCGVIGFLLFGERFTFMGKKRTNSGPLMESTGKHSISPWEKAETELPEELPDEPVSKTTSTSTRRSAWGSATPSCRRMTLHTDGGSLRWGFLPHSELPDAFYAVWRRPREPGGDPTHRYRPRVSGPQAITGTSSFPSRPSDQRIDRIEVEGHPPVDEAPGSNRGAGDQCDQRAGLAPIPRSRSCATSFSPPIPHHSGFGALPLRCGTG